MCSVVHDVIQLNQCIISAAASAFLVSCDSAFLLFIHIFTNKNMLLLPRASKPGILETRSECKGVGDCKILNRIIV